MYKPISYNVIRQAIQWSGLPDILNIRMLSSFKWPNGDTSGEYVLTFAGNEVRTVTGESSLFEGADSDILMKRWLQECFCQDVTVVRSWVDVQRDLWKVELYGRVRAHDLISEAQIPLF